MEDVNVWIFEETDEILVTDQTGGVPVDANQLFDFHGPDAWNEAVKKAAEIKGQRGEHWTIQYDSWAGRDMAEQADEIL